MSTLQLPATVTIHNLTGKWALDKSKTTGTAESMEVQGLSWFLRKIINTANIQLTVKHDGLDILMITGAPGVPMSTTETRHTDWSERENKISIFGTIRGGSRICDFEQGKITFEAYSFHEVPKGETEDDLAWLAADWLYEDGDHCKLLETQGMCIEGKWVCHQVWGFMLLDGERRHVRKFITWRGDKKARAFMVYNWLGGDV